ncbi:MAG: arylsulfatase [Reichenbachiella sp.]|uniref:arylsulfatase n=2 Tax=Reichenbachiella sp. TaxID=2184521 RepID=UPI0032642B24
MGKGKSINRRGFIQLSALASAGIAVGCQNVQYDKVNFSPTSYSSKNKGWNPRALKRKPNVLMVVLDDVGFGDLGCYGAEHKTECIDDLATKGTRFNNFHVTALCAPTRACLLTGRNAHAVGVGNIAEWGRDHESYRGWIRQDAATLSEVLKAEGYATHAIGKWHLSPLNEQNASGPFDQWPTGRGFDKWYGFHGNAMDHWHPEMFENTQAAYPDKSSNYHLSEDLVTKSIDYVKDHVASDADKPFFMYLAFGACHFPLHAPSDNIRRKKGQYDEGYESVRSKRFEKQKEIGIIPAETELSPLNKAVKPWEKLSGNEKRLAARGQEIYAAFLEHTDHQIQRVVDFLKEENMFDDTIVMVVSDNGAAPGSETVPSIDTRRAAYMGPESMEEKMKYLDKLGSDESYGGSSTGWSQVSNTPLKWYKADTYGGGTRSPLVVSWPNGNLPQNQICKQYTHAIDVVPTLLDMINMDFPAEISHQVMLPIQGLSFAYALENPEQKTRKQIQYFETLGDRAIWAGGWKAVTKHQKGDSFEKDVWELYHIENDFAEINNLADQQPEKLKELINLWFQEAEKYNILPMADDAMGLYIKTVPQPKARYLFFRGSTRLDRLSAPDIYNFNSKLRAEVEVGTNANGVILASGDSGAGYELYIRDSHLCFTYVYTRTQVARVQSKIKIPAGKHLLGFDINKGIDGEKTLNLMLNDKETGSLKLSDMWEIYVPNSGIRCGENRHAPISRDYKPPFVLDGLKKVVVDLNISEI